METSQFIRKLTGRYLWLNFLAMAVVIVILVLCTSFAMDLYTHHGETITVPDMRKHSYEASSKILQDLGMDVVINDTGYVKSLPPGIILDQLPAPGTIVKSGRTIYLTINATDSPTLILPDIIDNALCVGDGAIVSLGQLGTTQYVPGEKDWVYGILVNGKNMTAGDRISIESKLIIQAGNGRRDAADSVYMTDIHDDYETEDIYSGSDSNGNTEEGGGSGDDFEVIE